MEKTDLSKLIRDVPDFPVAGILFKDITTLLKEPMAYQAAIDALLERYRDEKIDLVAAIEARGLIFGAALAYELGAGLVPVRKPGKLPAETISAEYTLEYGTNVLEVHKDAIRPGQRVLIVDDVLATGGTAKISAELVERLGGVVVGIAFLIELGFLKGREKVDSYDVFALIQY